MNPFWDGLYNHSRRLQNNLQRFAYRAQQGDQFTTKLDSVSGAVAIALPIRHRHRVIGTLLACMLTSESLDDEAFARFCSMYEVDRLVFERLAADVPRIHSDQIPIFTDLLLHQVQSSTAATMTTRDVHDLSKHLAQVYEELHLIYRVGGEMTVFTPPQMHFKQLCEELTGGTVINSAAVVIEPLSGASSMPTVVRGGTLEVSSEDVVRLYHQVRDLPRNAGPALVMNAPTTVEGFAWTARWLDQFIFCELSRNDRRFGGLLAFNHADGCDFASYEIELLNAVAERSSAFIESVHLYDDLERLFIGTLHALVSSVDAKDPYTCGHSQRVAWLSRHIASLAGVPEARCQRVYLSGLLHDIGKIGISENVLQKSGGLTKEEFEEMKRHPGIGARILDGVPNVEDLIPGVLCHHERLDGKGYPDGLEGDGIPLFGRVVGLADSYDAMTTDRTYRKARSIQRAVDEIRRCSGTQFDVQLADLLVGENLEEIGRQMADLEEKSTGTVPWVSPASTHGDWT